MAAWHTMPFSMPRKTRCSISCSCHVSPDAAAMNNAMRHAMPYVTCHIMRQAVHLIMEHDLYHAVQHTMYHCRTPRHAPTLFVVPTAQHGKPFVPVSLPQHDLHVKIFRSKHLASNIPSIHILAPSTWYRRHVCRHVCGHVCGHVCRHVCRHVYGHVCGRVCRHVYRHVCRHVCRHVWACVSIRV